jgi:hypothetical protein
VVWQNSETCRKQEFCAHLYLEHLGYTTVDPKLFFVGKLTFWRVFDRPQAMPTSTGNERSG